MTYWQVKHQAAEPFRTSACCVFKNLVCMYTIRAGRSLYISLTRARVFCALLGLYDTFHIFFSEKVWKEPNESQCWGLGGRPEQEGGWKLPFPLNECLPFVWQQTYAVFMLSAKTINKDISKK